MSDATPRWRSGSEPHFDVLVIGAGPAGLAAACCAAEAGKRVGILDDNPHAGGQIWRHDSTKAPKDLAATGWLGWLKMTSAEIMTQTQIIGLLPGRTLLAESPSETFAIRAERIILACGARERFLPFLGWTLPGVFGAGGLQALVKAGYPIEKRKVVIAGSGPLLLAVAAYLRKHGADVCLIAEQTPRAKLLRFAGALAWHQPEKLIEGIGLGWLLRKIPYRPGCWPIRANGNERVESVTLTDGVKTWTEPCDALACGFGLIANLELPTLLGCAVKHGFVEVDDAQQTSIPGISAIGELTGIGGLSKALLEGHIAGSLASGNTERANAYKSRLPQVHRFSALLADAFHLRDELRSLPDQETIVCRCEDVTYGRIQKHANWRDAKLQTRCGMGPCQGRICGPAVQFLLGWASDSVRPPILPTALANLAGAAKS